MENEITSKEELQTQASGYIEEAVRKIYEEHPHEIRAILYGAASLILGYGAYKECALISRTASKGRI